MKLTIKNIGVIKEADIELSGLTVIAGVERMKQFS
jgi:DNA repair ATPase RecN